MMTSAIRFSLSLVLFDCLLASAIVAADVPAGEVTKHRFEQSQIFPGTVREYWVYIPKQYDPAKPACVHVNQDGVQFKAPTVFDQLIHEKAMPITIGVFIMHGRVKANGEGALDRFNRSVEYDGLGDAYEWLDPMKTVRRINATGMHGSIFTPHAAAVHPARLARGIARAVERMGGTVYEKTPARRIDGRRVVTAHGTVTADVVVRATEGYTGSIEGLERTMVPLGNFGIATEPIPDSLWAEIGAANRELFEDSPVMLAYGQRTADGRIVWGGLGAPYWMGSRIPASPMQAPPIARKLQENEEEAEV